MVSENLSCCLCSSLVWVVLFEQSSRISAYIYGNKGDWKIVSGTVGCYLYFVVVSKSDENFLNVKNLSKMRGQKKKNTSKNTILQLPFQFLHCIQSCRVENSAKNNSW